ncbi:LysM peptidoglycan-binding domain-containing protein [Thermodesulfitimonas autotrophica]|uniref:LysM peptidoglycan-binding domain-containing protein n=1 Tax=Thermodesulfitimonas autotrophica TaxID=1894989 RepID=UPI002FE3C869
MAREIITDDFGQVKLGEQVLPGVIQQIEIECNVRVDMEEVPGQSGSSKQPQGYEDAKITIRIVLPTDEESNCYSKVAELERSFKKVDSQAKPYVYRIVNKHAAARGISQVVYQGLRTTEGNGDDTITAEISLLEFKPVVVKTEQITAKKATTAQPADGQYVVKKGDTMWGIARTYGISLADLVKANPQIENPNLIYPGQRINIPAKKQAVAAGSSPAVDDDVV